MQNPKLSIIVPIYNGAAFLGQAVESVRNSTLQSWELILVNDGSTDSTEDLCRQFCLKDQRIFHVSQDNRGLSAARNAGFSYASGEFIAYLDADDFVEPEYYECLVKEAEESGADFIVTGFTREFRRKNRAHVVQTKWPRRLLASLDDIQNACEEPWFYNVYIHVWNKIYRRDHLIKNQILFDEALRYGEDVPYNLQALSNAETILFLDTAQYHYICRSAGQLTRNWNDALPDYNGRIYQQIAKLEMELWQIKQPAIAAGMYLRSCFLTIEKLAASHVPNRKQKKVIQELIQRDETIACRKLCRGRAVPMEFRIYSFLLSIRNPGLIYHTVMLRRLLKRIAGR